MKFQADSRPRGGADADNLSIADSNFRLVTGGEARRPGAASDRHGFDHAKRRLGRNDAGEAEAAGGEEIAILWLGAFAAAGVDQHGEIEPLSEFGIVAG